MKDCAKQVFSKENILKKKKKKILCPFFFLLLLSKPCQHSRNQEAEHQQSDRFVHKHNLLSQFELFRRGLCRIVFDGSGDICRSHEPENADAHRPMEHGNRPKKREREREREEEECGRNSTTRFHTLNIEQPAAPWMLQSVEKSETLKSRRPLFSNSKYNWNRPEG